MTILARGPQVHLDGAAQLAARGGAGRTMAQNIAAKIALEAAGIVGDGSSVDGTSITGADPEDVLLGVGEGATSLNALFKTLLTAQTVLGAVTFSASGAALAVTNNATVGGTFGVTGALTVGASNPITLTDGSSHNGAVTMNFPTRAAMLAFQPTNVGTNMLTANLSGRSTAGDGGPSTYVWVASSSATANDPFVLTPNSPWSGNGRWLLQIPPGGYNIMSRGCKCDGTTDDSVALSNLMATANTVYGNFVAMIPPGVSCYIGTAAAVTVGRRQELRGSGHPMLATNGSVTLKTAGIILHPSATLLVGGTLRDMMVTSFGLSALPADPQAVQDGLAAWALAGSIAITAQNDDATLENVMIVGFNKGFYSDGWQRTYMRNVHMDCINGIEITSSADTGELSNIQLRNFWAANLGSKWCITGATIVSGGSGYTNGTQTLTMDATGVTGTRPTISVEVSGGVVTSVNSVLTVGNMTAITGTNPRTFSGAGGTNATFDIALRGQSYRPGIGIYLHDQADSILLHSLSIGGFATGLKLKNVWEVGVANANIEAGTTNTSGTLGDFTAKGIHTEDGVSQAKFTNVYVSGALGTGVYFDHGAPNPNGAIQSVLVANMTISTPATWTNQQALYLGEDTSGIITNLSIAAPGDGGGASVVIDADVLGWDIRGVNLMPGNGATTPWYVIDETSSPNVHISSRQRVVSMTSGAALTALPNDVIYVDNATAPTITMPATAPLGQSVIVKDIGGQAAAHNITLLMPGASTIDGAGSAVISANYGSLTVVYNGTAASIQ